MTPSYLYVFRCGNGNYAAVTDERMIDRSREPLHETPEAAIEAALEFLPGTLHPREDAPDTIETERIEGYSRDTRAFALQPPTLTTSDRKTATLADRVFTIDREWGVIKSIRADGWAEVVLDSGPCRWYNGQRLSTHA